jgi:hypothetical protein
MNKEAFLKTLTIGNFAEEYYAFCSAFKSDLPFSKQRPRKEDVVSCLARLKRDMRRGKVDNAYFSEGRVDNNTWNSGFAFQATGAFEPWFTIKSGENSTGDNYASLAYMLRQRSGLDPLDPPYPRPEFCGPERLFELLANWDKLDQTLRTAAGVGPP